MHHGHTCAAGVGGRGEALVDTVERDVAAERAARVDAGQDLDQRRFPRAVFADESEYFAFSERQIDAVERADAREVLRYSAQRQH